MIKIITDSSTLYRMEEAKEKELDVMYLNVTINGKSYKEFVEMSPENFLDLIKEGGIPSSSQPSIGEVMELYEKYENNEIIDICMADGLSGTYQSALGAKAGLDNSENIHVVNTRTLCGPHRFLVDHALQMVKDNKSVDEILESLDQHINTIKSFLLPQDFDFLRRGGRLTPLAAKVGGLLKIQPVMGQTEDGCRLEKFTIARTFNGAIQTVLKEFQKEEDPTSFNVYISHAGVLGQAEKVKETFLKQYPNLNIEILQLSPAFITQGGPGCIAIQWGK